MVVFEGVVVFEGAWLVGDGFFGVLGWEDGVVGVQVCGVDEEIGVEECWEVFVGGGGDDFYGRCSCDEFVE